MKLITLTFFILLAFNVSAKKNSVTNMSKIEMIKVVSKLDKKCRKRAEKLYNKYQKMANWVEKKQKAASAHEKNLYITVNNHFIDVIDLTFIQCQKYNYTKAKQSFELAEHMLSFVNVLKKGDSTPIAEVHPDKLLPESGCDTPEVKREVASVEAVKTESPIKAKKKSNKINKKEELRKKAEGFLKNFIK